MARQGMLIDYEFCTGCHSCEMACKAELDLEKGQFGITLSQIGPWKYGEKSWQYDYIPAPTDLCDLCEERVAAGKMPSCIQHCQADIIRIGPIEELAKIAESKPKIIFYSR